MGMHPNTPEREEMKPSQAMDPESSLSVTSRFRPELARAVVSPIVSVAETRKIMTMAKIAPGSNTGTNSWELKMNAGRANSCMSAKAEKSTMPRGMATR